MNLVTKSFSTLSQRTRQLWNMLSLRVLTERLAQIINKISLWSRSGTIQPTSSTSATNILSKTKSLPKKSAQVLKKVLRKSSLGQIWVRFSFLPSKYLPQLSYWRSCKMTTTHWSVTLSPRKAHSTSSSDTSSSNTPQLRTKNSTSACPTQTLSKSKARSILSSLKSKMISSHLSAFSH